MIRTLGMDLQRSRTAVVLAECHVGVLTAVVGDGQRQLVPNAATPEHWGSAAVQHLRSEGAADIPEVGAAGPYGAAPWSDSFFRGLGSRLVAYLGQTSLADLDYSLVVVAPNGLLGADASDTSRLANLCQRSDLPRPMSIAAPDALLCRWLGHPDATPAKDVLVVACGEVWTCLARYATVPNTAPTTGSLFRPVGASVLVPRGAEEIGEVISRGILSRCHERVPESAALTLPDGVAEYAARLRAQPPEKEVAYQGALADLLFSPVRYSRRHLAGWTDAAAWTREVKVAARKLVGAVRPENSRAVTRVVLVGGPGAIWPFLADALAGELGRVWSSEQPELDLATGAALWPTIGDRISTVTPLQDRSAPPPPIRPISEPGEMKLPPWLRGATAESGAVDDR